MSEGGKMKRRVFIILLFLSLIVPCKVIFSQTRTSHTITIVVKRTLHKSFSFNSISNLSKRNVSEFLEDMGGGKATVSATRDTGLSIRINDGDTGDFFQSVNPFHSGYKKCSDLMFTLLEDN